MSPEVPQPEVPHIAEGISPRATYERPALIRLNLSSTEFSAGEAIDEEDGGLPFPVS